MLSHNELIALGPQIPNYYGDAPEGRFVVVSLGNEHLREWFEDRGLDFVCIDWKGGEGVTGWDLRYNVLDAGGNVFGGGGHCVVNFDFTEDITDYAEAWRNIHRLCRPGGQISLYLKAPGAQTNGYWQPSEEWLKEYAEKNGYVVELLCRGGDNDMILARFRKMVLKPEDEPIHIPLEGMHRTPISFRKSDVSGPRV